MNDLSDCSRQITDAWVSVQRINNFLISEEIGSNGITYADSNGENSENAIEIQNGNFYWVDPKQTEYLEEKEKYESLKKKGTDVPKKEKRNSRSKPQPALERTDSVSTGLTSD